MLLAGRAVAQRITLPAAERYRLANGLDIVLQEDHRVPRVAVVVAYDIGTRDDPPGYDQLAHLVEHLTYRGSRHIESLRSFELLERAGVERFNGWTMLDQTVYHAVVPANALSLALWIESERMAFTLERFTESSLELERNIIRSEIQQEGGPSARFRSHLHNLTFGEDHAYAMSPARLIDIDAVGLRHVQWFFQQGYRPSNAHLIVVGDFIPDRAKEQIFRYFGPIVNPNTPYNREPLVTLRSLRSRRLLYEAPVYEERLAMCWLAPRPGALDRPAAELLSGLVERWLGSRLVDQLGDAATLSFDLTDTHAASLFELSLVPTGGASPSRTEASAFRELDGFFRQDLSIALADQKVSAIVGEIQRLADPLTRALDHLESIHFEGKPYSASHQIASWRTVSVEDVLALRPALSAGRSVIGSMVRAAPGRSSPWGHVTVSP
jgi:zinc protease